jgi:hypothetical protein
VVDANAKLNSGDGAFLADYFFQVWQFCGGCKVELVWITRLT